MKVSPIIFSAPMVLALLAGRKTQTRRLAWQKPRVAIDVGDGQGAQPVMVKSTWQDAKPGDLLYVRENFAYVGGSDPGVLLYGATWKEDAIAARCEGARDWARPRMTPCIHMPRKISRLTLSVTAARVEKLQAISKADVIAEGITHRDGQPIADVVAGWHEPYAQLWDSLHGAGAWEINPDVVALTYSVHRENIDSYLRRAA